jgi:hypothetical protein
MLRIKFILVYLIPLKNVETIDFKSSISWFWNINEQIDQKIKLSKLLIPTSFSLIFLALLTEKEVLSEDLTSLTTNPSHSISDVFK